MTESAILRSLADELAAAETSRRAILPLTERHQSLTVAEAYGIQQLNVARRTARGERVVGHKIGLTALAMQELFGVHEPDYGHLLNTMVHDARVPLDLSELVDPQIEVEPGFILGEKLTGKTLTAQDVLDATEAVCVCLEIIDSRIVDWRIRVQDTVADNGSSARIVIGGERRKPGSVRLESLDTVLELDGVTAERGNTSAILGHPANGIAWLARALDEFGIPLEAGDIVLPGTCTRSRRIARHKSAIGRIDQLGELRLDFINQPTEIKS